MYIYKFTHIDSSKSYIGQTIQDPEQRKLEHITGSKYTSKSYHFHNALRKYGIESFTFEVIDSANSLEELNFLEEKYVNLYDSIKNGYNIRNPGNNKKHNPESIERMRIAQREAHARRRKENREGGWKRRDGGAMKGKKLSEKTKEKQRQAQLASTHCRGKTWKLIDGKRVWLEMEASV